MRRQISGALLNVLAHWHGALRTRSFGAVYRIPIRGKFGLALVQSAFRDGTWKSEFFERAELRQDQCFLDVGANIGQTLLEFRSVHADRRYFGFDPNPAALAYLNDLIGLNGFTGCDTFAFAASDRTGLAMLTVEDHDRSHGGGSIAERPSEGRSIRFGVATLPLDDMLQLLRPLKVGLIKVDVEGAEVMALRGMKEIMAQDRPLITCEVLFRLPYEDAGQIAARNAELVALLEERDYRLYHMVKTSEARGPIRLRRLDAFPQDLLTSDNLAMCDYVCAPAEAKIPFEIVE